MRGDEMAALRPDAIMLDEFRRGGAPTWQRSLAQLLSIYPEVKLLDRSTTNISYLDNRHDMTDELFDGCIASEITLGGAIARGALNAPPAAP